MLSDIFIVITSELLNKIIEKETVLFKKECLCQLIGCMGKRGRVYKRYGTPK